MRNAGVDEAQAGLKIARRNINNLRYADGTSREIDGEQWKQCQTLFFGAPKITEDGDCSHEIKRHLQIGRAHV